MYIYIYIYIYSQTTISKEKDGITTNKNHATFAVSTNFTFRNYITTELLTGKLDCDDTLLFR